MKELRLIFLSIGILFFASCGKDSANSTELIAGTDSKAWKATKELNRQGDKEKLSENEKKDELRFYTNGTFTVVGETDHKEGKWNYNQAKGTLSLQFQGQDISESFKVVELDKDDMKLQSPDGSQMILEAEE